MRISDWSSDVCSSDLAARLRHHISALHPAHKQTPLVIRSRPRHCSAAEAGSAAGWTRRDRTGMEGRRISRTIQPKVPPRRSEEHTSELQSLMRISYAVFCLKKKKHIHINTK